MAQQLFSKESATSPSAEPLSATLTDHSADINRGTERTDQAHPPPEKLTGLKTFILNLWLTIRQCQREQIPYL